MIATLAPSASHSVRAASQVHRELLEAFMGRVRARLAVTSDAFVRDSLTELLATLDEQRDSYPALVEEPVAA